MTDRWPIPTWQERIGGRWAISIQSYLVGAVLNITILAFTGGQIGADAVQVKDVWAWACLGLVAALVVGIYALAANASVFKHRRERAVPPALSIIFHLGVGFIFGCIIVFGGDRMIEPSAQSAVVRICVITLIGLWWGLTTALVLEARDRFNCERESLIEQVVQLELATISETETAMRLRSIIKREAGPALDVMRGKVDEVLAGFATQTHSLLPVEDWWSISQSLRSAADATIRPLSHQLWEATVRQYPSPKLGRVLSRLMLYQQYALLPTMTILAIGYLPAGVYRFGVPAGILATVVMTAGAVCLLAGGNALMRWKPRAHVAVFLGTFVAVEAYAVGYLAVLAAAAGTPFAWDAEVLGGAIAIANSVLLPAAYASLNSVREDALIKFHLDTDHARVHQLANARQLVRVTRNAARELHGTVQTRLIACAVAIEQAMRSGDIDQFRQALEASIAILDSPLPDLSQDRFASVHEEIERMCAPWEGLCDIHLDLDVEVGDLRGPVAIAAGRIVEEAVANACRHGMAEDVKIRVRLTQEPSLIFEIDDDGAGPQGGVPGLGTAMLAGMSRGQVALSSGAKSGSRLTVVLPID